MSPETVGIIGIAVLIFLFLIRTPVAFAMIFVGFVGFAYLNGVGSALVLLPQNIFGTLSSYPLSVIPMFILMGFFAFATGISRRLFHTSYTCVGQVRGGLTVATVLACAGFAAVSGSTAATAATMGKIALPEMKRYGYDDVLSTGTVAAAGTLGILIPPSATLIVYGILTEESIGKLFIAGILPGMVLSLLFVATVVLLCLRNPALGPQGPRTSWAQKARSLTGVIEAVLLFLLTIGGLFLGWFSPTQAGAVGAAGALLIGVIRRQITLKSFVDAVRDGVQMSCMILFIITGAIVFGRFLVISNIPSGLADLMGNLPAPRMLIMVIIILIFFVGGFFMDSMGLIVVLIPIFFPLVTKLGFDPIWFGVIVVLVTEMGVITPPVGVNVFVIKGICPEIPLELIFKGIMPFLGALIIMTAILLVFPHLATFLPSFVSY